jgi:hypothetical protein
MRRAQAVARDLPGVIEVQTYGDLLHVFVDGTDGRERELVTALNHSQIEAHELRRTRPRMEEVFISLIEKQEAAGRNGA